VIGPRRKPTEDGDAAGIPKKLNRRMGRQQCLRQRVHDDEDRSMLGGAASGGEVSLISCACRQSEGCEW
jgi:hypothetical protein